MDPTTQPTEMTLPEPMLLTLPQPTAQLDHPSNSCIHHLQEQFIGFCPSCLYERLAVPEPNSSSSSSSATQKRTTFCSVFASLNATFHSFAFNSQSKWSLMSSFFSVFCRTKSFSVSKNDDFFGVFKRQRKSSNVKVHSTLLSLFNQEDEHKISQKERSVEVKTRNLVSSSIIQGLMNEEEEERNDEIRELPNVAVIEIIGKEPKSVIAIAGGDIEEELFM